jgi:hypothetical protein
MNIEPIKNIEKERIQFRSLILGNPNYFGNLTKSNLKPVTKIITNTTYEQLTCVGFNPAKNLLEATIAVKLPYGYGGDLCSPGTMEYVRFFLDYGSGWEDVGYTGVNVHDIPTDKDCAGQQDKPMTYVATLKIQPKTDCCDDPVLPKVHAILSWQWVPPAGPANVGWLPPYGNALECNIQVSPHPWNIICLLENIGEIIGQKIKVPPMFEAIKHIPLPVPDPSPFTVAELAKIYSSKAEVAASVKPLVESHRFGISDLHAALTLGGFSQDAQATKVAEWKSLGFNWAEAIAALGDTKANVNYEELECLGIDDVIPERLVATFRIKQSAGYSGDLCHAGSFEYVAFWADWDDKCEWTYLGTANVNVHDVPGVPQKNGLCYSAILPVDLTYLRRNCDEPKIARIRAVLSWAVPPSTTDPDALNYWGNSLDTHVQINPGDAVDPNHPEAKIRNLGGIAIEDIDTAVSGMTIPTAKFAHYPWLMADGWNLGRPCPFGGTVVVEGNYYLGFYYRIRVRSASSPPIVLADDFWVERSDIGYDHQVALPGGWFQYLNPAQEFDRILAKWSTSGDDIWEVQLDVATAPNDLSIVSSSPWYKIQLDNTAPSQTSTPITMDIHIDVGGDCKTFDQGKPLSGIFIADDLHFGAWGLSTEPNSVSFPSNQPISSPLLATTSPAPAPGGNGWTLDTQNPTKMKPCGYVIRLDVYDRSIVGSYPGSHNWNHVEVGFCLRATS